MVYEELLTELTQGLQEAGVRNFNLDASLDPDEARAKSMANIAEPIAKAIRDGVNFKINGVATCAEINLMTSAGKINEGDVWGVKDNGSIRQPDGTNLQVSAGDLVIFSDGKWVTFLHIDLSSYATKTELQVVVASLSQAITEAVAAEKDLREAADSELSSAINTHAGRTDNPHQVTASQVGAYTKSETDDAISDALSGNVGGWLGNLTVTQVNALTTHRKGDSATMLDSGIVNPGNLSVDVGDDIMWVDSLSEWQAKISDHLHHDSTLVGTGATSDPLGVNPQTIASAISTHDSSALAHADIRQAISDEVTARDSADDEIIESLEDETTARRLNDELLSQQIQEVAVQTDWEEDDPLKLEFLKNKPSPISTLEIDALFV